MNKSVYSLVLMDDVVQEIDRLAYENGSSRSAMINEILADYVSYITPEKRMREIFSQVERLLTAGSNFQVLLQPSDSMFSLRSALAYKYNPTVRYSVELSRRIAPAIGELRVSVRSQNSTLRLYMLQFFKLWSKIEQSMVGRVDCAMADDKYVRSSPDGGWPPCCWITRRWVARLPHTSACLIRRCNCFFTCWISRKRPLCAWNRCMAIICAAPRQSFDR